MAELQRQGPQGPTPADTGALGDLLRQLGDAHERDLGALQVRLRRSEKHKDEIVRFEASADQFPPAAKQKAGAPPAAAKNTAVQAIRLGGDKAAAATSPEELTTGGKSHEDGMAFAAAATEEESRSRGRSDAEPLPEPPTDGVTGSPRERQRESPWERALVVRSTSGEVVAKIPRLKPTDRVAFARRWLATRLDVNAPLLRLSEASWSAATVSGSGAEALDDDRPICRDPALQGMQEWTVSFGSLVWDKARCGKHVAVQESGLVVQSDKPNGEFGFASPGFEVLGTGLIQQGPFRFSARLRGHLGRSITLVGVAGADTDVKGHESHVNDGASWALGSDGLARHAGSVHPFGAPLHPGDVVCITWADSQLSVALNGHDFGVMFSDVPLPLRPYAHCCDSTNWELSASQVFAWDAERAGGLVRLTAQGRVAGSSLAPGGLGLAEPGHEVLGRVAFEEGPFTFAVRLLSNQASTLAYVGVARAGVDVTDEETHVNDGSVWSYGSDGRRHGFGVLQPYGRPITSGDVVTACWRKGRLRFALNGDDQGVAFTNVPLPLRPFAHCSDGVAWDLGVTEGYVLGRPPGGNFAEERGLQKPLNTTKAKSKAGAKNRATSAPRGPKLPIAGNSPRSLARSAPMSSAGRGPGGVTAAWGKPKAKAKPRSKAKAKPKAQAEVPDQTADGDGAPAIKGVAWEWADGTYDVHGPSSDLRGLTAKRSSAAVQASSSDRP